MVSVMVKIVPDRTQTRDCLIRSPFPSETGSTTGGQGETKPRLYQVFDTLEQTGKDIEGHVVAVKESIGRHAWETRIDKRLHGGGVVAKGWTLTERGLADLAGRAYR